MLAGSAKVAVASVVRLPDLAQLDENIDVSLLLRISGNAVIAANERRKFLERSAEGMNRAAKEGRYTGGIVPLGYSCLR